MIEFDVDMSYLLECGELDKVVLNDENGEHEPIEFIPADVKAGSRSCAACPEMDSPDSYISLLQAALKWHDEHVPRPTNPRNTCVVLKGKNKPDEVLFIHDEGGEVMHYLPEDAGTCRMKLMENMHTSVYQDMYECDRCGEQVLRETYMGKSEPPKFCPECGRRNEVSE